MPLADVPFGAWYEPAMKWEATREILNGVGDGMYLPSAATTRGMIAQILYNLDDAMSLTAANPFRDVYSSDWYYDAVAWAAENGVVLGYGDDIFAPGEDVTREQLAAILYRYAAAKGYDISATGDLGAFVDGAGVSSWAQTEMRWAVGHGLIVGKDESRLDPQGKATRAEVAMILMRFCTEIVK